MTLKDFSTIQRMLGFIEGAIADLDKSVSCGILDAIEVIDTTLEKEVRTDGGDDPVRHGGWVMSSDRPDTIICSCCDSAFDVWKADIRRHHYCPNCGAGMDGAE